jgi:Family of unknown function (DUF6152)
MREDRLMKWTTLFAFVAGATMIATEVAAAEVAYDPNQFIILDGEVKSVDWSGSHLKISFHSNDGYDGADWTLTGPAPDYLLRMGWTKDSIKAGDRPDAVIHADESGTANGALIRFLLSDYETLETGPHGSTQIYPRGALTQTYGDAADDPLASNYGNTRTCRAEDPKGPPEANYSCRLWVNADHTMMMFENNKQPDGTYKQRVDTGVWWLERQLNRTVSCTFINGAAKPRCHSPVEMHKVGDKWSIQFHGANAEWTEYRELLPGRQ